MIADCKDYNCSEHNKTFTKNDQDKANEFQNFFTSVFTCEPFDTAMPDFPRRNYVNELTSMEITREKVLKKLKGIKINKSPGPDQIHPRVLHEIAEAIAEPISIIFNTSLKTMTVPTDWKLANVTAIHKKDKKTIPSNYRPVSLTSVICKLMESFICEEITRHLKNNNLFSTQQFGFITGRSTTLQMLHVLNLWSKILDEGGSLDVVYCDFMKAFDKVPHRRLFYKVQQYGISGEILGWINLFLTER